MGSGASAALHNLADRDLAAVVHCTGGGLLIATASLKLALVLAGHWDWPARRFGAVAALTMVYGIAYTMFSEWLNIVLRASWAYSELMPVVRLGSFELGLSPIAQWIVVPVLAFAWVRRGAVHPHHVVQPHRGIELDEPRREVARGSRR